MASKFNDQDASELELEDESELAEYDREFKESDDVRIGVINAKFKLLGMPPLGEGLYDLNKIEWDLATGVYNKTSEEIEIEKVDKEFQSLGLPNLDGRSFTTDLKIFAIDPIRENLNRGRGCQR